MQANKFIKYLRTVGAKFLKIFIDLREKDREGGNINCVPLIYTFFGRLLYVDQTHNFGI